MLIEKEVTLETVIQAVPINNTRIGLQNAPNVIDPTSCNHFFKCTNTRSVRERCPSNLFYDPKSNSCEFSHKGNCIQKGSIAIRFNSTEIATVATSSPLNIYSSAKFSLTADPKSCEQYFERVHRQPFRQKYLSTLYFNSKYMNIFRIITTVFISNIPLFCKIIKQN